MRPPAFCVAFVLLLGSTVCSHAQDTPAPSKPAASSLVAPKPLPAGRITGTVLCNDTHKPARGALVMVMPLPNQNASQAPGTRQTMTRVGNDGTYLAEHLAPGEYTVVAFQPGYLNFWEEAMQDSDVLQEALGGSAPSPQKQRELLARNGTASLRGSETATFNVTLDRGATLSGRVFYSDGSPATQTTLMLEDVNAKPAKNRKTDEEQAVAGNMMRSMFTHQSMNTDDEGHFRISGIRPGSYRLAALQAIGSPLGDENGLESDAMGFFFGGIPDMHAIRFYVGDTPHRAAAKVMELRAGDAVSDLSITVPVDAFHTVRGSVAAQDGRMLNMGSLTLTDAGDDALVFHGGIDREGNFRLLQIPAGTYTLAATDLRIGKVQRAENEPEALDSALPLQATNAFADSTTSLIVKDGDVNDVRLTVSEVPLPKADPTASPKRGDDSPEEK